MKIVNCFDVVSMVVEEATEQYGNLYSLNKESYKMLEQYCTLLDAVAEETNATQFEAEILEIDKTVSFTLWCEELQSRGVRNPFAQLVVRAATCKVSFDHEDVLRINFIFPSLWEHKEQL